MSECGCTPTSTCGKGDVDKAALAFVASTSVFRQPKECRAQFEELALAVLALPKDADGD